MSKSPSSNILIPAIGGAALVLGAGFGIANINYGSERIEALESRFQAERAAASAEAEKASELEAAVGELRASADAQLAEIEAQAEAQVQSATQQVAALKAQLQSLEGASGAPMAASLAATGVAISEPAPVSATPFGVGRDAHPDEIAAWDVDVLPDGRGLPEGSGDVWTGEEVFAEKCVACHGDFAEGRDAWPVLAGGFDTLADPDPVKTIGSYWPYLSTVWDYVHRSMPFGNAGTLSDDEVYAITAYILYSNDLVDDDFTLSRETFGDVDMYNTDGFVVDNRADAEYAQWRREPCMSDCKDAPVEITRRSTDVGVTPADDGSMEESVMEERLAALGGVEWGKERVAGSVFMGPGGVMRDEPETETQAASTETVVPSETLQGHDPALVAKGESAFKKCSSCHQVGEGARNRSGPVLNGVTGRGVAALDGFKYSNAFKAAKESGTVWDDETLAAFLTDPRGTIEGTKMSFRGFKDPADVEAVIAYLKTFQE